MPETEQRTIEMMKKVGQPISIDWLAHNLGVGWGTARGILMNMALKRQIQALKTTKSFIFILNQDEADQKLGLGP
jgi:DNA-binding GntR family transcriptional regulator